MFHGMFFLAFRTRMEHPKLFRHKMFFCFSESVKCRFRKCRFSAELEKLEKKHSRWGASSKNKSKKPWASCRGAGIDAALVRVQFVLRGYTHDENDIEFKIQNTKVASAKVAFDTVRFFRNTLFPNVQEKGLSKCRFVLLLKGTFVTDTCEPCFEGIWVSDFPYVLGMDKP